MGRMRSEMLLSAMGMKGIQQGLSHVCTNSEKEGELLLLYYRALLLLPLITSCLAPDGDVRKAMTVIFMITWPKYQWAQT